MEMSKRLLPVLLLVLFVHGIRAWQVNASQPTDFRIFYEASIDLHRGADPYADAPTHFPYIYPPLLAWAFGPLTALPLLAAAEVWVLVCFAAWLVLAAVAVKLSRSDHGARTAWIAVLPSLIVYRFILSLNLHGQVDLVLWALVALHALALNLQRDRISGALLGLALVIKPLPVLFLAALVFRRRFVAAAVAVGTAALLLAAPALTTGPARAWELLDQWKNGRIGRDLTDIAFEVHGSNQSLQAFLYRYTARRADTYGEVWPAPIAALEPATVNRAWMASAACMAAPLPWLIGSGPVSARRFGVEVAWLTAATHLISRRTMEYHLVSLVLVYAAMLGLALCPRVARGWRFAAGATFVLAAFCHNVYARQFVGREMSNVLQARCLTTLALILSWGLLAAALVRWDEVTLCSRTSGGSARS